MTWSPLGASAMAEMKRLFTNIRNETVSFGAPVANSRSAGMVAFGDSPRALRVCLKGLRSCLVRIWQK